MLDYNKLLENGAQKTLEHVMGDKDLSASCKRSFLEKFQAKYPQIPVQTYWDQWKRANLIQSAIKCAQYERKVRIDQ